MKLKDVSRRTISITLPWYSLGALAFMLTTWLAVYLPQLIERALDQYLSAPDEHEQLKTLAVLMVLAGLGIAVIRTVSRILVLWCGRLVESWLREQYFGRVMNFRLASTEKFQVGDLISRLTTDARQVGLFYGLGIVLILNLVLTSGFALSYMLAVHVPLTAWVYIPMAVQVMSARLVIPRLFRLSKAQQATQAQLAETVSESLYHIHALHAEGCVDSFLTKISENNSKLQQANVALATFRERTLPFIGLFSQLAYVIVLMYGGALVVEGAMTVGQVAAFQAYVALQSVPLIGFGLLVAVRERAKAALARFADLEILPTNAPADPTLELPAAPQVHAAAGGEGELWRPQADAPLVHLRGVRFRYEYPPDEILAGLDLDVLAGEHLGISGKIGSGKTTLFKVLMKLYEPSEGSYEFGGQDIRRASVVQLRQVMGYVTQEGSFFSDTIAHNLTLGLDPAAASAEELQERMIAATRVALIYDEIQGFEHGFATQIGEKGLRLSGGQKARLSLARALLRPKLIYLLDDIFSALDHGVEQALIHNLSEIRSTFILVSHRPSVLEFCHRRLQLVAGRLHERP